MKFLFSYILKLKDTHDLDDYFGTLLDFEVPEHRLFLNDFKQRLSSKCFFKRLQDTSMLNYQIFSLPPEKSIPSDNKNNVSKKKSSNSKTSRKSEERVDEQPPPPAQQSTGATKKKNKFVNLYSNDGESLHVIMLKGRHHCDCQASKHKLVNNCMKCGRIVCEQEGSGPCLYCGSLVCSEDEVKVIESLSKKGDNLKKSLMEQQRPKGWEEALAQRNRLLEYDRTSEKRTAVIDDQSDYFKQNSVWLSDSERKKLQRLEDDLRDKKYASRLSQKVTLDFTGRQIIEEPVLTVDFEDEILKEIANSCTTTKGKKMIYNKKTDQELSDNIHPGLTGPAPIFDISVEDKNKIKKNYLGYDGIYNKVQDKEFLEMTDTKNCLSMHQPWASLLIAGIKQHEGRTWYSSHRGRLWIASTAKPVDMEEVKRLELFYRLYHKNENLEFPSQFPSGCLLGCVSVQDCLPQEEYRKKFPDGESDSPFVLICSDFQELPIRFPVKGQHKICRFFLDFFFGLILIVCFFFIIDKMDPNIHQAATKSLQRIQRIKAEDV